MGEFSGFFHVVRPERKLGSSIYYPHNLPHVELGQAWHLSRQREPVPKVERVPQLWGVHASLLKITFRLFFNRRFPQLLNSSTMVGNSYTSQSTTVDYLGSMFLSVSPETHTHTHRKLKPCYSAMLYRSLSKPEKSTYYSVNNILSQLALLLSARLFKILKAC